MTPPLANSARHVAERLAPTVCSHCRPLLENEQRMHDEAFQTLAQALDAALIRAVDAEDALRERRRQEGPKEAERNKDT